MHRQTGAVAGGAQQRPYRFDELGWLQFERLCLELLALSPRLGVDEWHRSGRVCSLVVREGIARPGEASLLVGPTLVVVVWVRPAGSRTPSEPLRDQLERALAEWRGQELRTLLVLTNVPPPELLLPEVEVVVLGPRELSALVAASWGLRLRVPTVLGIGAAEELIDAVAAQESTADVAAARALAPLFVPTRAYAAAVQVLTQHRFVVLTGPPEMGKTAIARTIGLAALTDGWEVHECIGPHQFWARFRRERRQVFIADDAFGSTEYRPEAAERWALELDRVLRALDEQHWLLWTSRPAPFRAGLRRLQREHGVERFPQPAQLQVDAVDLDVAEKALILFRHAKTASLPADAVELLKAEGWSIVSHPHFTPERIRRFVATRLLDLSARLGSEREIEAAVAAEIREPTEAMAASFHALSDQHRALLLALLDTPPGPVTERELANAFRRHSEAGSSQQPAELVDRLTDHFLRRSNSKAISWVHPSWRDLVIEQLRADEPARARFLQRSSLEGLLLAVSTSGGAEGERQLPLICGDRDWDAVAERLLDLTPTLEEPGLNRLFIALAEAHAASADSERQELEHLARSALAAVAGRWSRDHNPIPLGSLQNWLELADLLADPPRPPELGATWVELAPTAPIDPGEQEDLVRFDDWTALSELLDKHAPDALARFGFPATQRDPIEAFLAAAEAAAAGPLTLPPARLELVASSLWRLSRLGATDPGRAAEIATRLAADQDPELPDAFPPRPLSPELLQLLDAPAVAPASNERLVARILDDL